MIPPIKVFYRTLLWDDKRLRQTPRAIEPNRCKVWMPCCAAARYALITKGTFAKMHHLNHGCLCSQRHHQLAMFAKGAFSSMHSFVSNRIFLSRGVLVAIGLSTMGAFVSNGAFVNCGRQGMLVRWAHTGSVFRPEGPLY